MHSSWRFSTNDLDFAWYRVSQCLYVLMQSIKRRANWTALLQMIHRAQHEQSWRHVVNNLHFSTHTKNCYIYILRFPTRPALGLSFGRALYRPLLLTKQKKTDADKRSKVFVDLALDCGVRAKTVQCCNNADTHGHHSQTVLEKCKYFGTLLVREFCILFCSFS